MATFKDESGNESILFWEKPEWEIDTWCRDSDGQDPAEVHYILMPADGVRLLVRFTTPKIIDELILGLVRHRNDVWPLEEIPLGDWTNETQ